MFSFVGDTVLDPFAGTMQTGVAAIRTGGHLVLNEVARGYVQNGIDTITRQAAAERHAA